ncbi:MAG: class I SAM-dependent methyltransferase [Candidatus Omnitrophota bacterium]|nr:class I SAM-dependent methyltransferase [Candidatus Omnitrophota bacterium]
MKYLPYNEKMIKRGIKIADSKMYQENKIWARYSNDKVDIGEELAKVIRTLTKTVSLNKPLRALSIGSNAEPQFRILETAFRGGLYLMDVEKEALNVVKERICRQYTEQVKTICKDYNKIFINPENTKKFLKNELNNKKVDLIAMHHSLYYSEEKNWHVVINNLYHGILAPKGAMHIVLMSAESDNTQTTTWLYNHFVCKYFACRNNQNLIHLYRELKESKVFKKAQILLKTSNVYFNLNDFEKFMAVIWMIMLYPNVHNYNAGQKKEITEFVYNNFWRKKKALVQSQDHLAIYRGISVPGIV